MADCELLVHWHIQKVIDVNAGFELDGFQSIGVKLDRLMALLLRLTFAALRLERSCGLLRRQPGKTSWRC